MWHICARTWFRTVFEDFHINLFGFSYLRNISRSRPWWNSSCRVASLTAADLLAAPVTQPLTGGRIWATITRSSCDRQASAHNSCDQASAVPHGERYPAFLRLLKKPGARCVNNNFALARGVPGLNSALPPLHIRSLVAMPGLVFLQIRID